MIDLFGYLSARPYPGRGILLGTRPDQTPVCAYFIMGRSVNSRNRVFETAEGGICTRAFDAAKLSDPSLILYRPVRRLGDTLIVANGDQTDTIHACMARGGSVYEALSSRAFEPDAPYFTPRISGVAFPTGKYLLSILRANGEEKPTCERFYFNFEPQAGAGHFISTYEGFGEPLPSFAGEPLSVSVPALSAAALAERLWNALDRENRVSLYVLAGGEEAVVNKNGREAL
ncbi:MAG: IMP cyclohydrolase [Clostridiaceae bacterium]|nr:IMP cyclohydrolase [Eubacteriales bacterium]